MCGVLQVQVQGLFPSSSGITSTASLAERPALAPSSSKGVNNSAGAFDKLGVTGGGLVLSDVDVVLQADPDMAAEKKRLRHHGKGLCAKSESAPDTVRQQAIVHAQHRPRRGRGAWRTEADLVRFTDHGPVGRYILTYSQSADPTSPNFFDQTKLFSEKKSKPILFNEKDILADPRISVLTDCEAKGPGN
jgi:hypothetical protein